MSTAPQTTIVGNLTEDPKLRYLQSGAAVVNLTIAFTPRQKQGDEWVDGTTLFLRGTAWRDLAENIASTFTKGMRVLATGMLKQNNWETPEGERRSSVELEIDAIGPELRYATATVTKRLTQRAGEEPWGAPQTPAAEETWDTDQTFLADSAFPNDDDQDATPF